MCGIAGIARFASAPSPEREVAAMIGSLVHRGPDDGGVFADGGVALGSRRLAVIDLSPHGHQPMSNEDGSVQVVFNGEIYNHLDLRSRLLAAGHAFRSRSDTEVLVHGFEEFGPEGLVKRLEGMFAFAILDRRAQRLHLARDPFGVKPLYLRRRPGQLSFASEIRAFAHDGEGQPEIDPTFIQSYLRVGYVPSPACAFRGVEKLPPGTVVEVDLQTGSERTATYFELRLLGARDLGRDEPALREQLESTLDLAIRRQLVSDAPLGVFLSGGLDSSTISLFASRRISERLKTFTIGFERSDRGDETAAAGAVARGLRTDNAAVRIDPTTLDGIQEIVASLEEPIGDSAIVPLWHLCRATRARVTVALSGEGGDEALGGYARYYWGARAAEMQRLAPPGLRFARWAAANLPERTRGPLNFVRRAGKLAETFRLGDDARYLAWFDIFTAEERAALAPPGPPLVEVRVAALFERGRALGLDPVQRLQYVDIQTFLLDNLLLKSDRLSMAHGLEVRVPLLDRPLLELGLSLPLWAKVSRTSGKTLLRKVLRSSLPRAARRPKRGFELPVDAWFRDERLAPLRQGLLEGSLVRTLGFSRPAIEELLERHGRGEDLGRKLFSLLVLELWGQRFASGRA
jgi:asparagine synthase (glutamine-hydrolysing)